MKIRHTIILYKYSCQLEYKIVKRNLFVSFKITANWWWINLLNVRPKNYIIDVFIVLFSFPVIQPRLVFTKTPGGAMDLWVPRAWLNTLNWRPMFPLYPPLICISSSKKGSTEDKVNNSSKSLLQKIFYLWLVSAAKYI